MRADGDVVLFVEDVGTTQGTLGSALREIRGIVQNPAVELFGGAGRLSVMIRSVHVDRRVDHTEVRVASVLFGILSTSTDPRDGQDSEHRQHEDDQEQFGKCDPAAGLALTHCPGPLSIRSSLA